MNYIILSVRHSSKDEPIFWRADDSGYINVPWGAGIYSEEQVKASPKYYNNGYDTIAIPLTDQGIRDSGLKFSIDSKLLKKFIADNRYKEVANG
jgi:hypothetical protein